MGEKFLSNLSAALDIGSGRKLTLETELKGERVWDSLGFLLVVEMLDTQYGQVCTTDQIASCKTVDDIRKLAGIRGDE